MDAETVLKKATGALVVADQTWARKDALTPWSPLREDRAEALARAAVAAIAAAVKARADELGRDAVHALDVATAEGWAQAAEFILEGGNG